MLDTDIWTHFRRHHPAVAQHVSGVQPPDRVAITVVTVEEQLSGWYTYLRQAKQRDDKARAYQQLTDTVKACSGWEILPFPEAALARYEQLHKAKLNIGKMDICIAAITLEHNGILVSRNLRDFQRVPGPTVEDWTV